MISYLKNILKLVGIFAIFLTSFSCEEELEPQNTNYVTFSDQSYAFSVEPNSTQEFEVTVFSANITGNDRTFAVEVDGSGAVDGTYQIPETVTIPANTNEGNLKFSLNDTNLGIATSVVSVNLVPELNLSTGYPTEISYSQSCTEVQATLDFDFDGYADEVSWEITDSLGGIVASQALGSYANGQESASETITLCEGRSYTLTIYDDFGDGLSFPEDGSYSLSVGGSVLASGSGNYGASDSTDFDTN